MLCHKILQFVFVIRTNVLRLIPFDKQSSLSNQSNTSSSNHDPDLSMELDYIIIVVINSQTVMIFPFFGPILIIIYQT